MALHRRTLALHLALSPGMGGRRVVRVLARNAVRELEPEEFLRLSPEALREEYGLPAPSAAAILDPARLTATRELESRLEAKGVRLVTAADAHFPNMVERFDPRHPGCLFLYGNLALLERPTFCVLASRGTTPDQSDDIERLTEEGVLGGEVPVCGHDRPEYRRAALVSLRWGAPRILAFDRGLFTVLGEDLREEPFRAARLWRYEFDPLTDLAISPFRPDAGFVGVNNQVRDRLVGALSRRLDFVNVAPGGGMAGILRLALADGRPVRVRDDVTDARAWYAAGAGRLDATAEL